MSNTTSLARLALLALAGLAVGGPAPSARAEFLADFSGNTSVTSTGPNTTKLDGVYNFAVLNRTGGTSGDTFGTGLSNFDSYFNAGTGSGGLNTSAKYLYLFEVVNSPSGKALIQQVMTSLYHASDITSWGSFYSLTQEGEVTGVGFKDNKGAIGVPPDTASGNYFGSDTLTFDGVAHTGVTNPGVMILADGSSVTPLDVFMDGNNLRTVFSISNEPNQLANNSRSVLIGFTSDFDPTMGSFNMRNSSSTPSTIYGAAPIPNPEPSAQVLAGVGVAGLLGVALCRRRSAAVTPA